MDNKLNQPPKEGEIPQTGAIFGSPQSPSSQTTPQQTQPPKMQPQIEPSQPAPPPPKIGSSFNIFSLFPFIIGFLILIVVIFVGIKFIGPRLTAKKTPTPVTLTYWGLWEDQNIMSAVLSDFEKEHPEIKVEYRKWDIKQYRETLSSRIAQNIGPDVFRFHNTWFPMFKDYLVPIPQDIVSPSDLQTIFPKVVKEDLEDKGALFGIPLSIDTMVLFINKDMFSASGVAAPKTWEELAKAAGTLTLKDESKKIKTSGVALGTYSNINHASDIISLMVLQNHGDLYSINPNSPTVKNTGDALCFYISFAKNDNPDCSKKESFIWDDTQDSSLLAFTKEELAMYFGYSWDIFTIKAMNPRLSLDVVRVPQLPNQNLNIASYWVEGVSKKSKHQKEALELLKFLNKKETLQKLYSEQAKTRLFGEAYARMDLGETLKDDPVLSIVEEEAKTAVSTPFSSDTFDNGLNQELDTYLSDLIKAVLGNTSIGTASETFMKGVAQTKQKYAVP